ncbi:MAG: protein translocase subunit SecD [Verrucomicrobia bacterium]|nr:protein translocase subunit SecD [Verrucomicrobiota bacterium]
MSSSLRWRIVLVIVVTLFALALVWPTIRWATLSPEQKSELNLLYYEWDKELEDDLAYSRKQPKQREGIEQERAQRQKALEAKRRELEADPAYQALKPVEQRRAMLDLELRARTPRTASLGRNTSRDLYRWWYGDEGKILRLGLDLQGGIYMVLETEPDARDLVYEKLRQRIDQFGVAEPLLQKEGDSRIIVQLPGATDLARAERLITERAVMKWALVEEEMLDQKAWSRDKLLAIYDGIERVVDPEDPTQRVPVKDEDGNLIRPKLFDAEAAERGIPERTILRVYEDTEPDTGRTTRIPLLLQDPAVLTGDDLVGKDCHTTMGGYNQPVVAFRIGDSDAIARFTDSTKKYSAKSENNRGGKGWRLAILLDDKVISAPHIAQTLTDSGVITGSKNYDEADDLALKLRTGSLPAEIRIVRNTQVGPSLGADSIRMGWRAAVIGLICVALFMGIYYRLAGLFSVVALAINLVLLLGALAAAGATLTLPGIAGIILTIGMAVDANVLVFERIREELAAAKKVKAAVEAGYHKALRTILDANITTLITAAVLFFLGTGPVRGFAVTLSLGICTSVFSAIVVTRVLFDVLLLRKSVETVKMFQFFSRPSFDFLKWRNVAIVGSAAVVLIGLIGFGARFSENWGTDFRGGTVLRLDFGENEVQVGDVRTALKTLGFDARVQAFDVEGGKVTKTIAQIKETMDENADLQNLPDRIEELMGVELADRSVESISASVSKDLAGQTAVAFVLALVGILIYVSWRFEFRFAVGAIVALLHDVLIALGFFAGFFVLTRRQIDTPTIAAFLTIVGYSLNDTIVIFDRIREDLKIMKRLDFRTIVNTSINQTLSRTVLTSLTTLLVVIALFMLGGQAINDFSFAMLIGIIAGTYSTIYIATPILVFMHKKAEA